MKVTPAEFARMAGVERQSVYSKIKHKTLVVDDHGFLDTDNILNRAYLDKNQNKLRNVQMPGKRKEFAAAVENTPGNVAAFKCELEQDEGLSSSAAAEMLNMTLREIVARHGNLKNIERYSKILKDLNTADEKAQRLQEKRQMQIPRDFVVSRIFGFTNQLTNKILDVPEAIVDNVAALAKSDSSDWRQKIILYVRDVLSRAIGGVKENVIKELNSLRTKYNDENEISGKINEIYDRLED